MTTSSGNGVHAIGVRDQLIMMMNNAVQLAAASEGLKTDSFFRKVVGEKWQKTFERHKYSKGPCERSVVSEEWFDDFCSEVLNKRTPSGALSALCAFYDDVYVPYINEHHWLRNRLLAKPDLSIADSKKRFEQIIEEYKRGIGMDPGLAGAKLFVRNCIDAPSNLNDGAEGVVNAVALVTNIGKMCAEFRIRDAVEVRRLTAFVMAYGTRQSVENGDSHYATMFGLLLTRTFSEGEDIAITAYCSLACAQFLSLGASTISDGFGRLVKEVSQKNNGWPSEREMMIWQAAAAEGRAAEQGVMDKNEFGMGLVMEHFRLRHNLPLLGTGLVKPFGGFNDLFRMAMDDPVLEIDKSMPRIVAADLLLTNVQWALLQEETESLDGVWKILNLLRKLFIADKCRKYLKWIEWYQLTAQTFARCGFYGHQLAALNRVLELNRAIQAPHRVALVEAEIDSVEYWTSPSDGNINPHFLEVVKFVNKAAPFN